MIGQGQFLFKGKAKSKRFLPFTPPGSGGGGGGGGDGGGGSGGAWVERATDPPTITHWWNPAAPNDNGDGLTRATAKKTFSVAVNQTVAANGVLGIVNGTYNETHTGLSGSNTAYMVSYSDLTPTNRLWIRADDERQAVFVSENGHGCIELNRSANVTLWGITARSEDNVNAAKGHGVLDMSASDDPHMIRCLVSKTNNGRDMHGMRVQQAIRPYFEECEVYDFMRHGFALQLSKGAHLRRCYANARWAEAITGNPDRTPGQEWREGFSCYRSNYTLVENCVSEGGAQESNQCEFYLGEMTGHSQLHLGGIGFGSGEIIPTYARDSGSHYRNKWKHYLLVSPYREGIGHFGGTDWALHENYTIYNAGENQNNGPALETSPLTYNGTGAAEYQALTGKSGPENAINAKNMLIFDSNYGAYEELNNTGWSVNRALSYWCLWNNAGTDSWVGTTLDDNRDRLLTDAALVNNAIPNSINSNPISGVFGPNFAGGQTMVYIPEDHPTLANAGDGEGIDGHIGATVLYRYEGSTTASTYPIENLTNKPLWNPETGQFPHGAVIPGHNDFDEVGGQNRNRSLHTLHTRLGVSKDTLPDDYSVSPLAYPQTVRSPADTLTTEQNNRMNDVLSSITHQENGTDTIAGGGNTTINAKADNISMHEYEKVKNTCGAMGVGLALTGRQEFFDEADRIFQLARGQLDFGWRHTNDGNDGNHDVSNKLLIWVDTNGQGGTIQGMNTIGKDTWDANDRRSAALMVAMAEIYRQNPTQAVTSYARPTRETSSSLNLFPVSSKTETTGADRLEFCLEWLKSWEYKNRVRYNKATTTPGGDTDGLPFQTGMGSRFAYALFTQTMYTLTGNQNYADWTAQYVDEIRNNLPEVRAEYGPWFVEMDSPVSGSSRRCLVWSRLYPGRLRSSDGSPYHYYLQPITYAHEYSVDLLRLVFQETPGMFETDLEHFAHSLSDMGYDIDISTTTTNDWRSGSTIGGHCVERAGIPPAYSDDCPINYEGQVFNRRHYNNITENQYFLIGGWDNGLNTRLPRLMDAYTGHYGDHTNRVGLTMGRLSYAIRHGL